MYQPINSIIRKTIVLQESCTNSSSPSTFIRYATNIYIFIHRYGYIQYVLLECQFNGVYTHNPFFSPGWFFGHEIGKGKAVERKRKGDSHLYIQTVIWSWPFPSHLCIWSQFLTVSKLGYFFRFLYHFGDITTHPFKYKIFWFYVILDF